jgi:integrase
VQLKHVVRAMEREIGHWLLADLPGAPGYVKIKAYREGLLKDGSGPATANRRISILKVALREAVREGHLKAMPEFPDTLDEDNVIERELSDAEEVKVLAWFDGKAAAEAHDPEATGEWTYMRHLIVALLDTGARLSEVLKLKACDGREVVFVGAVKTEAVSKSGRRRSKKNTKSGKTTRVPLTARASVAVTALLAHPLHGQPQVDADWSGHRWMQVRRAIPEIDDVNLHILRHTFACRLLALGVDLFVVNRLLGHASVDVTAERYANRVRHTFFENVIAVLQRGPVLVRDPRKEDAA